LSPRTVGAAGYFKILKDLVELNNRWLWLFQSSQRTGGFL
jgi:hypothetical protein